MTRHKTQGIIFDYKIAAKSGYLVSRMYIMILGSKGLLPPTDACELLRRKAAPAILEHSKSADLLRKSLLFHVWRVPSSKALSCKHERLFDLLTLASYD